MLLRGNLKEFSLPNVFQLVKMSAKTGCLTLEREGEEGKVFFRDGRIYYASSSPQGIPLGERLVKAGRITTKQLKTALAEQRISEDAGRLGAILIERGAIDRATLEQAVREQIEDVTFNFFSWSDGEFAFAADETFDAEDIVLEMNVENVIMEGCRRIDEWELIFEKLGSLEKVPHLAMSEAVEDAGEVGLTADEWRVVCSIDDRRDIGTVLRECGLDRFNGAKVIYSLFSAGLVSVSDPVIEGLGSRRAVVVRGPIDIYNEVFLNTLTDTGVTEHLRVEMIDEKEVEIPIHAATFCANGGGEGDETLVFTTTVGAPEQVVASPGERGVGVRRARQRQLEGQPARLGARLRVRAQPRGAAVRRGHVRVDGRGRGGTRRGAQGVRPAGDDPRAALQPARPRVGRRRRRGRRAAARRRLKPDPIRRRTPAIL